VYIIKCHYLYLRITYLYSELEEVYIYNIDTQTVFVLIMFNAILSWFPIYKFVILNVLRLINIYFIYYTKMSILLYIMTENLHYLDRTV